MKPKHLYTTEDVRKVRKTLLDQQKGTDPITGMQIPEKQAVLDHDHGSQYVRAVLHRQTNAVLGKIENLWNRYLSWWYTGKLSDFLRGCADYLDKDQPKEYIHPSFVKKLQTEFNKLSESNKNEVLKQMKQPEGKNSTERKAIFAKAIKSKSYDFEETLQLIRNLQ
jgi:Recombination endonuclease VII